MIYCISGHRKKSKKDTDNIQLVTEDFCKTCCTCQFYHEDYHYYNDESGLCDEVDRECSASYFCKKALVLSCN